MATKVVALIEVAPEGTDLEVEEIEEKKSAPIKTMFDAKAIEDPLVGTPKEVQKELDGLALYMQKHPDDDVAFQKVEVYVHKYLLGLVFKKYSFVRGQDEKDMYQEALIAIFKKAIPNFNPHKGMSFLNFAKMCINRHLITILHASRNRRKDMPINQAISLDQCPMDGEDGNCTLANIIADDKNSAPPYKELANKECYQRTLNTIRTHLSKFEIIVLDEYLNDHSYKEAARNITKKTGIRYNEKSVDNALLRIRKKAAEIISEHDEEAIPLLF